jgi:mannose-1-phosphate guanylyltransferase/mannose-6-phosphate isomerase
MTEMASKSFHYAVVLAGGSGTRFWPMSRVRRPKQFLPMLGGDSLFQATIKRIQPLVPAKNILVVSHTRYQGVIREQLRAVGCEAAGQLLEPQGKNTAPAIAWAAAHISRERPDAVMAVLPSDHLITSRKAFLTHVRKAFALARARYLVTMGIVPTRPETGYGYIKMKQLGKETRAACPVERFVEKPSLPVARRFLRTQRYLWNSGMFFWRCDVIRESFSEHLPEVARFFSRHQNTAAIRRNWAELPDISVDYGILEKARQVLTIPAGDMGWSDMGSWEVLVDMLMRDKAPGENVLRGDAALCDCAGTLVWQEKGRKQKPRLIAGVGLQGIMVIDTPDALLVCRRDASQRVKDIVRILQKNGRGAVL